ncbi:MAG: hypothetical protein AAF721_08205 [Myxococcota bacterium]
MDPLTPRGGWPITRVAFAGNTTRIAAERAGRVALPDALVGSTPTLAVPEGLVLISAARGDQADPELWADLANAGGGWESDALSGRGVAAEL